MTRSTIAATSLAILFTNSFHSVQAFQGPAPVDTAVADYDPVTGQITVSVNSVNHWYIESLTSKLTGDAVSGLPAGGGSVSNNDQHIAESSLNQFSYTDVNLGNVAATGLSSSDLTINWTPVLGTWLMTQPVVILGSDPTEFAPVAEINATPPIINIASDPLNIVLDATGSTDDGSLETFVRWDLDNNNYFEIETDSFLLEIADVTETFGGPGVYPVTVLVTDGKFTDTATTTVTLVIPEPTTCGLATLATLCLIVGRRRSTKHRPFRKGLR